MLETTDTSANADFKREMSALGNQLNKLQSNISDLEQVLQRVQNHRSNFAHISDDELAKRQRFIRDIKRDVSDMKSTLSDPSTTGKLDRDRKQNLMRRSQQQGIGLSQPGMQTNAAFIEDRQQMQEMIVREQDEHLDALGEGATRLGHVALAINDEINAQNVMLDGLQNDLDLTSGRMEQVLGKVDKLLKTDSRWQTNTILTLMMVLLVLILLVAWT